MKRSTVITEKNRGAWATVFGVLILLPVVFSIFDAAVVGAAEEALFLEAPDPRYEACVEETTYMRFHHMDLLKEVRGDVIRRGLKGGITLAGCGDCHTNRDQFCDKCHERASVTLDCWGCHYYLTAEELQDLEAEG